MPSDDLIRAIGSDVELDELGAEIKRRLARADQDWLARGVQLNDDAAVIGALGLMRDEAGELERALRAKAEEYADRFPELRDAARFFGPVEE